MTRADESGWIAWEGGEICPIEGDPIVEVRFRPLFRSEPSGADIHRGKLSGLVRRWQHHGTAGDVLAYRIVADALLSARSEGGEK